jgi:hypothetical protein
MGDTFSVGSVRKSKPQSPNKLSLVWSGLVWSRKLLTALTSTAILHGRQYTGETDRPLAVLVRQNRHVLRKDLPERSKTAVHIYEECYMIGFCDDRILEVERSSRYKKYKEKARVVVYKLRSASSVCKFLA